MGKIGTTELLVVLAIVLIIFGPKALPKLGRSLGKTLGSFRKGMNDSADDDDDEEEVVEKKKKKKPDRQQKAPQYAELFLRTVFIWHLYRWNPMQYLFR